MRVETRGIFSECLCGRDGRRLLWAGPARAGSLKKCPDGSPCTPAQVGQELSVVEEVESRDLGQGEGQVPVRHGFQHVVTDSAVVRTPEPGYRATAAGSIPSWVGHYTLSPKISLAYP